MTHDPMSPEARVAAQFMEHKGLHVEPYAVEQLDGQACWYFYYALPEGDLELEVAWDGAEWNALVTTFTLAG